MKNTTRLDPASKTTTPLNPWLQPAGSPIDTPVPQQKYVPWEFGIQQGMQLKKIRSSTGYFKKLSATLGTTSSLSNATISASLFNQGSITNSNFSGTISQPVSQGGTFTNPTIATGTLNLSQFNNGTLGTPAITGGTFARANLTGTATYAIAAGTAGLGSAAWQFQLLAGTPVLAFGYGGTTFYWQPTGIL